MTRYHKQTGFTLIELVIVIVILGILAAAALPRFSDLSTDARVAAVNGLAGSVRSAAAIAHATQLAKGLGSGTLVSLEGQAVLMSNGYPTASNMSLALSDISGFTTTLFTNSVEFRLGGRSDCKVSYLDATGGQTFTVTVTSTGGSNPC